MTILVTGGLGFLGSHLVDRLLVDGHSIVIVDNQTTNAVSPDFYRGKCKFVYSDVANYEADEQFDIVFHLASVVGPAGVLNHAGNIGYRIMEDTKKMFELCIKQQTKFILISTSEVYGRDGIFSEGTYNIVPAKITVRCEYGAGKLLAEVATINKAKVTDLKYHIIRPFNIAGPRQRPLGGFVLPRFIEACISSKPITVFGNGTQQRALTHVKDIVDGILSIASSDKSNEVWNIGNIKNLSTINELADLVKLITGTNSKIIHVDPKTIWGDLYEEAFDKLPNIGKIQSMLGWKPRYDLVAIIKDTYDYYLEKRRKKHCDVLSEGIG